MSRQYQDSFKSRSNHELAPVFHAMICKKDNLRLVAGACRTDRLHSVRVACQYKEILENGREMCGFFATEGLSYSFNKRWHRTDPAGEAGNYSTWKLFLTSMGQIAKGICWIIRNYLERQERIRMRARSRHGTTQKPALQSQRREIPQIDRSRQRWSIKVDGAGHIGIQVSAHSLASS